VRLTFLHKAQQGGMRLALRSAVKIDPGVNALRAASQALFQAPLKRQVPLWLRLPEFRSYVLAVEEAHSGYGGAGALYVRLRRARTRS